MADKVGSGSGSREPIESLDRGDVEESAPQQPKPTRVGSESDSDGLQDIPDSFTRGPVTEFDSRVTDPNHPRADGLTPPPSSERPILLERNEDFIPPSSVVAELSEIEDPTLKDFHFEITQEPKNYTDKLIVLKIKVDGKEYRLKTRGPSSKEKVYEIAKNSAKTAFLVKQSGVRSCRAIQLHDNGDVNIRNPILGQTGALKEQFDEAISSQQLTGELDSVSIGRKGNLILRTASQKLEIKPEKNKLRLTPFVLQNQEVSNVADAISGFVGQISKYAPAPSPEEPVVRPTEDPDSPVSDDPRLRPSAGTDVDDPTDIVDPSTDPTPVAPRPTTPVADDPGTDINDDVIAELEPIEGPIVEPDPGTGVDPTVNPIHPAISRPPSLTNVDGKELRTIDDVFDFADRKKPKVEKPGYLEAIFRGKSYQPVFKKGKNIFSQGGAAVGNWLLKVIGKAGTDLVHKKFEVGHTIDLTDDLALGFSASGQKIKESSLKAGDPRLVGIEELRNKHPRAIPVWVEGKLGQNLSFNFGHNIPLGASGAFINFGFKADEKLDFTMNRLVHFERSIGENLDDAKEQMKRLTLTPLKGESLAKMETGASFNVKGSANLRLDAGIGLGASIPAINNLVKVGANVEAGAFATLSGEFGLDVTRLSKGKTRVTISSGAGGGAGVKLSAFAGVQVEHEEIVKILGGFVKHVTSGGDPDTFGDTLESEEQKALASSMSGYTNLLTDFAKNLAEGTGAAAIDHVVANYASAAFEARKGIDLKKQFSTNLDFDFKSEFKVTLPRQDMLPPDMWKSENGADPIKIEAGKVATLAYNMAVRGDLRLAQQASLIRNSGVRINEQVTTDTNSTTDHIGIKLPFLEFSRTRSSSTKKVDRYTPEMGRTKSLIESFNQDYVNFFGDIEDYGADIRVHTPEGKRNQKLFLGSDENFSADFVIENLTEKWTNFEEMQDYLGVLNALSEGRLEDRCHEALAEGEYRDRDDINIIEKLFYMPREYGRTTARLHVWLGEEGLRSLLNVNYTDDDYYEKVGEVFANLNGEGQETLPWWAAEGADRKITDRHGKVLELHGGGADAYGVEEHSRDLKAAKYLVENLMDLQIAMRNANTPDKEKELATKIRDFLEDAKNKYSSYAALAMLVPEQHRAVEMRLSSIRPEKTPIRFTYIQDGRSADLLDATGYSKMVLKQLTRYGTVLDPENKARIGNLLKTVNGVLNSPSPDLFILKRSLAKLEEEMLVLDTKAPEMEALIAGDIGMARAYLDTLPDAETIQEILPGMLGTNLATMRINVERELNKPTPKFTLVREQMKNILAKMPYYRQISGAHEIIDSTAQLSKALATARPDLVQAAVESVNEFRATLEKDKLKPEDIAKAREKVISVNGLLSSAMGERLNDLADLTAKGAVGEIEDSIRTGAIAGATELTSTELKEKRQAEADKYRALAGDAKTAAVSYFERTKAVPKAFMGTALKKLESGVVTASMIRDAELAMATSRPTGVLSAPALSQNNVEKLLGLAKEKKAQEFVTLVDQLRFRPEPNYDDPNRIMLESLLASIPKDKREGILKGLSKKKKADFQRVFKDFDAAEAAGRPMNPRESFLDNHPAQKADLKFLREIIKKNDVKSLEAGINSLGYSKHLGKWHAKATTRLEAVFSKMTGDQLNTLVGQLSTDGRKRFLELVKTSDLRPQTRAKLAGTIVDNNFFWRKEEELVAALVTNLNAGDLRLFFDQLYKDGKLENFLKAGSWWQFFLQVFTFGLARLWTHNNEAAIRVVAAKGWKSAELQAQYNTHLPLSQRIDQQAESIFLEAALDTVPIDPVVKSGLRAVNSICGNVKYYHYKELPKAGLKMLEKVAEGAGEQLIYRLGDVASQGGSPSEIVAEYEKFFKALTPENIAKEFREGDKEGTAVLLAMSLKEGALKKLNDEAKGGKNKFITPELITFIGDATTTGLEPSDEEEE